MKNYKNENNHNNQNNQISLVYRKKMFGKKVTAKYSFEKNKLSSISYISDELPTDELNKFMLELENKISKSIAAGSIFYICDNVKKWNSSDGFTSEYICLYSKDKKCHYQHQYFY